MDEQRRAELRKCPLCGSEAERGFGYVGCTECYARVDLFRNDDIAEAITTWNRRPVEDALRRALETILNDEGLQDVIAAVGTEPDWMGQARAALREGL